MKIGFCSATARTGTAAPSIDGGRKILLLDLTQLLLQFRHQRLDALRGLRIRYVARQFLVSGNLVVELFSVVILVHGTPSIRFVGPRGGKKVRLQFGILDGF